MVVVYSLCIVNKSGGVVFFQSFSKDAPKLTMNDALRLGSTFHGLYVIASNLSPVPSPSGGSSSGMQVLQADTFKLQCYQTPTEPGAAPVDTLLRNIYETYSDYVLKNPFYDFEQPIRCEQFDVQLEKLLTSENVNVKH